ncbi:tetratricopeptide (TPR) repeat protein [Methanolinea mesophila]|uniref:tetratricopeptide repeat protein n=1 Tax=Methanolinea mesophila TaxID=547055 RepID=UPI001AE2969A|nr:tetratricopeptide repeat protein [Methanolinea mesophila]MBP1929556.1 tetratricopeptide (TPR) repeat protein [Methanolinea mesophila]
MAAGPGESRKREAFRLFEDGRYDESYAACMTLPPDGKDEAVAVLCATNLFYMGRYNDAEAHFRDLARVLPGSSHVQSYLGRILEMKGDDEAVAAYARAVRLDPANQEALRRYSAWVMRSGDWRKAIPVLEALLARSGREDDARSLMGALVRAGRARDALEVHRVHLKGREDMPEYSDALIACGEFRKAQELLLDRYTRHGDPADLRGYLHTLSMTDREAAREAYRSHCLEGAGDTTLCRDYLRLLRASGNEDEAFSAGRAFLEQREPGPGPLYMLEYAEIAADLGRREEAGEIYASIIRQELAGLEHPDLLARLFDSYRHYLVTYYPVPEALDRFRDLVLGNTHPESLCAAGRFYEAIGDTTEARAWFYRSFRADFLRGGIEYARFLQRHGDGRECEKTLLYVLQNLRKTGDLVMLAGVAVEEKNGIYRHKRLREALIARLDSTVETLPTLGLEYLSVLLLVEGSAGLQEKDYSGAKRCGLRGLDVLPHYSTQIGTDDFTGLLAACKARSLTDLPVLPPVSVPPPPAPDAAPPPEVLLGLDEKETAILEFLRAHRTGTEMDLRAVAQSRRVAGLVNRIIQKAAEKGLRIIEKKGVGENGEIYEYTG